MKYICLLIVIVCALPSYSKAKYVARYKTIMTEITDNSLVSDSIIEQSEMTKICLDGKLSVTVFHQILTAEREASIKRKKFEAGVAAVSAIGYSSIGVYSAIKGNRFRTMTSIINSDVALEQSKRALKEAEDYQNLDVCVMFENTSDDELYIHNNSTGQGWFIPAHGEIYTDIEANAKNSFRLSTTDLNASPKSYLNILAENHVDRYEVSFEDTNYWYYKTGKVKLKSDDLYFTTSEDSIGIKYYKMDKQTYVPTEIPKSEYHKH